MIRQLNIIITYSNIRTVKWKSSNFGFFWDVHRNISKNPRILQYYTYEAITQKIWPHGSPTLDLEDFRNYKAPKLDVINFYYFKFATLVLENLTKK